MEACLTGVNYNRAPAEIRERLAVGIGQLEDALSSFSNYASEGIILSTCNRTEVYTLNGQGHQTDSAVISFLKAQTNLPDADLLPHIYLYHNEKAIKHLFCVASGLDSMIIGEFEILGQIYRALEEAEKRNLVSLPLRSLFQQAIGVGRRARKATSISRGALSVSSAAVELAAEIIGDISRSRILVIGAGEAGRLVAKAAKERQAQEVFIATRNQDKASAIATISDGKPICTDSLDRALTASDIVISCTAAPHFILKRHRIAEAMLARPERPLVIIDMAVPRDVEPEVRQVDNVYLYDIDDFTKIAELNRQQRQGELQQAIELVDDEVRKFTQWWQALEARPTISALAKKAENIRQAQLNMTLKKLPSLSNEERANLDAMTKSIVQKILHEPIQHLQKNSDQEAYIKVINELFGLDKDG
jgi:glutamyl-tRNA reductase